MQALHSRKLESGMKLFGPTHLVLLAAIVLIAVALVVLCRRVPAHRHAIRLVLGWGIIVNELVWWRFRYSHEGIHLANLPLQLCDITLWASAIACLTLVPAIVDLAYFAGLAGAGMALLTPDLWSPWPAYPAIYFFVAHGAIVIACAVLVFGRVCPLSSKAVWRAYGLLLAYAFLVGLFNKIYGTNYMYLCRKPKNASLLDALGPWPWYLVPAAVTALALFWLLWLPASRGSKTAHCPDAT
jgi:hypothetical integral membrane protein (TIGR02206 family)